MTNTVAVYIHIPFCLSKCSYCDFYSLAINDASVVLDNYINQIVDEFYFRVEQFNITNVSSIYIGGGTPSLLSINQISKLLKTILPYTQNDSEITIECNPDDINEDFLINLINIGINRISIGIQCLSDISLKYVKRRANRKTCLNALLIIDKIKNNKLLSDKISFSVDLISGLPFLTTEDFIEGLNIVCKSRVDHISLYSLTIEQETELAIFLKDYNEELNNQQWLIGKDILQNNGFYQYEVSNFSKKGFESKHNLTYWKKNNYIGLGSFATGSVNNYRYTNSKLNCIFEQKYTLSKEEEFLDDNTLIFEYVMMGFRTVEGISKNEFYKRFNLDLSDYLGNTWKKWINNNLAVEIKKNNDVYYALNSQGILFLNKFLEEIL